MRGIGGYYLYRALSGLFGLLPEPAMRKTGEGLGWLISFFARDRLAMAARHQQRVQGPGIDARKAARRAFASYGRYMAETFWVTPRRRSKILAIGEPEGIPILKQAQAGGKGVILALPHVGNWEAAGLRAAAEDARVLAVAEALPNPRIVDWFVSLRKAMDIDVVILKRGVTRKLIEHLDGGGVVALLSDRDLTGRGIEVDFFGERTTLPAGPVSLAERTGAPILPVGTYFKPGAGHLFKVHEPLSWPSEGDAATRRRAAAQALAVKLEEIISAAPEQWHLLQPNWPSDADTA